MNWKTELAITLSCCWTRSGSWRDSRSRTLSLPFCLPPLTDSPGRKSYAITPNWSENEWNEFRFRSLVSQPSGNCMQRLRASRKGPRTRRWAIYIYQIVMNRAMRKFSPESIFSLLNVRFLALSSHSCSSSSHFKKEKEIRRARKRYTRAEISAQP